VWYAVTYTIIPFHNKTAFNITSYKFTSLHIPPYPTWRAHLWRIDDRRAEHAAIHAAVADGKRAARHIINRDAAITCLAAELIDALCVGVCWCRRQSATRSGGGRGGSVESDKTFGGD
jgi:hypothetical protein